MCRVWETCVSGTGWGENSLGCESRVWGPRISPRGAAWCSEKGALPSQPRGFALLALGRLRAGSGRRPLSGRVQGLPGTPGFSRVFTKGRRGLGGPRVSRVQGLESAPAHASPSRALPPLHSPAPDTWVPLRDLRRPRLPIRPPTGLSSQRLQPPSGVQGPGAAPRPGAGSEAKLGRGPERPGCRAREEGAPSPLGAVSMLCTWGWRAAGGPFPGPGDPGAPRLRPVRRVGSARRLPSPRAGSLRRWRRVGARAGGGVSGLAGPSLVNILFC